MPDHVHMMISILPRYAVSQVIGYIKGKNAIHRARVFGQRKELNRAALLGSGILRLDRRSRRSSDQRIHQVSEDRRCLSRSTQYVALRHLQAANKIGDIRVPTAALSGPIPKPPALPGDTYWDRSGHRGFGPDAWLHDVVGLPVCAYTESLVAGAFSCVGAPTWLSHGSPS